MSGALRDLHVLTHSSPTRRSSDLPRRRSDARTAARRQPRLQRGDWGSPEKSEGNGAVLRLHRMMEPMRLDDAAHIGRTRQIAVADPLVDEHVVETEIDRAIGSDAAAHPCPGVAPAKPHAREEARSEEHTSELQ